MIGAFSFEHGGRAYSCTTEVRTTEPTGTWWWFEVTHDQVRYAPFEVAKDDTQHSVQTRIVAYYERLLWVRAQPVEPRQRFGRPGKPAAPQAQAQTPAPAKP